MPGATYLGLALQACCILSLRRRILSATLFWNISANVSNGEHDGFHEEGKKYPLPIFANNF